MQKVNLNGIEIAYLDEAPASGVSKHPPVVLVHGFASKASINWVFPGWTKALKEDGRRVIALDNRGHGESEKLYETEAYTPQLMAADVIALMDHLNISEADVMGYSMGARIAAVVALIAPERVRRLVFGGLGLNMVQGVGFWEPVAKALLTDDPSTINDPQGIAFRAFADQTKSDRKALAACIETSRQVLSEAGMGKIVSPTLIAVGSEDDIGGPPGALADMMLNARALELPGRDHMKAVGDRTFKQAAIAFLNEADA